MVTRASAPVAATLLLLASLSCSAREQRNPQSASLEDLLGFVGRLDQFPGLDTLRPGMGWIVNPGKLGDTTELGADLYVLDGHQVLVVSRHIGRDGQQPRVRVLSVTQLPSNRDSLRVVHGCSYRDSADDRLIALVRDEDAEWLDDVLQAWRIDLTTGHVDTATAAHLRCREPFYRY